ncbi:unnamed protein product [Moneuplotes crassus]|uniref:USP domain-containing protein n=1 Tax=Euplotes crassus TaxID=5936 RepID=A0AAD1XDE8_EUPCR|nr:unnamed protein product [Moneuplotes crassus]
MLVNLLGSYFHKSLSGWLRDHIEKFLENFVEGINADQFRMSLSRGVIDLKNLSIKPTILDSIPLPLKIRYGKVGSVFVDIPVTSILSSPLKIEIRDIFILINPKDVNEWNEEDTKKEFIEGVQLQLEALEDIFKAQLEIQNTEPGMWESMKIKILDNIQIDIKNICFRFEDSISNEKTSYALGINLETIQLYTCNEDWERDFVSGKDISLKMAKITNSEMYLNYCDKGDEDDSVNLGNLEEDMDPGKILQDLLKRSKRNRKLIEKFCIEAKVKFNKTLKKNSKPMVDVNLVIGGKFMEERKDIIASEERTNFFRLQKQQMNCILKYLDYSAKYREFKTEAQKSFLAKKFRKEESQRYMTLYEEYKRKAGDDKRIEEQEKVEELRGEMKEIEERYAYETIAALRQAATNRYSLDPQKAREREEMWRKIERFEYSKTEGVLSLLLFPFGRSKAQNLKDKQDTKEFRDKLIREFEEKYKDEEEKIDEASENLFEIGSRFNQEALRVMPDEWAQFLVNVFIPKLRIALLEDDSWAKKGKAIMEIEMVDMRTDAQIGQNWQKIDISFAKLNFIDNITENTTGRDISQSIVNTIFSENPYNDGKDSLKLHFETNPRFEDWEVKTRLYSKISQHIFAHMPLVKELQEFFGAGESSEELIPKSSKMQENLDDLSQLCDYIQKRETQALESHFEICRNHSDSSPFDREMHHKFVNYSSNKGEQDHQKLMINLQIIQILVGTINKDSESVKGLDNLIQATHSEAFNDIIENYKEVELIKNSEDALNVSGDHVFELLNSLRNIPGKNLSQGLSKESQYNFMSQVQKDVNERYLQEAQFGAEMDKTSDYNLQRSISDLYEEEQIYQILKETPSFIKEEPQMTGTSRRLADQDQALRSQLPDSPEHEHLKDYEEEKGVSLLQTEAGRSDAHCFPVEFKEDHFLPNFTNPDKEVEGFSGENYKSCKSDLGSVSATNDYVFAVSKPSWACRGIQNEANNCFMIVTLQMLFSVPEFTEYLGGNNPDIDSAIGDLPALNFKEMLNGKSFTYEMAKLSKDYFKQETSMTNIEKLRSLSEKEFGLNEHHDASRYLLHLFDNLQNEQSLATMSYLSSNDGHSANSLQKLQESYNSIIDELFMAKNRIVIICKSCSIMKEIYEEFNMIPVPIKYGIDGPTIDNFFENSAKIYLWKPERSFCGNHDTCTITERIVKAPRYLLVSIQRFYKDSHGSQRKNEDIVLYPNEFTLENYVETETKYSLKAVICHSGDLDSGHYYAYCRRGLDWYYFNDEEVYQVRYDEVDPKNAYMLTYEAQV